MFKIVRVIFFPPNIFVPTNSTSRHAKPYMYRQPFARTNSFFYSFVPHTISAWNSLPGYVTNMTTSSTFNNAFIYYAIPESLAVAYTFIEKKNHDKNPLVYLQ